MSDLNEKKAELQELDNDLRRLRTAVQQFDEFETSGKVVFLGFGSVLLIGGLLVLAGSYYLAVTNYFSVIFSALALIVALLLIFGGARLLMIYFKVWNTLRRSMQIINEVRERKLELEREIGVFAD